MVFSFRIAISGANGFVAKNLRAYLARQNIMTTCFARRNFKSNKNEIKVITLDYSEKTILSKLKDCNIFIHLAGTGKQTTNSDYMLANVDLTKKLVSLCKKSGIKKFIFISGLGTSSKSTTCYFISKYAAEQEIINSKINYTIFRPSFIIGQDDYLTKNLKKQIHKGKIIIPGSGKFRIQPIHINDVCTIMHQVIHSKKYDNKIIDLVGPQIITYQKLISYVNFKHVEKTNLEDVYRRAIKNPNYVFGIDDLNILVGDFVGDFKKLEKLSKLNFTTFTNALKSSGLS